MPPIGSTLTDDQIAGVLTYVRREWGQAGDPGRSGDGRRPCARRRPPHQPWTDDELLAMIPGGRGGRVNHHVNFQRPTSMPRVLGRASRTWTSKLGA